MPIDSGLAVEFRCDSALKYDSNAFANAVCDGSAVGGKAEPAVRNDETSSVRCGIATDGGGSIDRFDTFVKEFQKLLRSGSTHPASIGVV